MKQGDVLVLHGGGVWTDAEGVDDAFGLNDLQYKLLFGFRYGFPSAAEGERLLGGSHFAGEAGGDRGGLEVVSGLGDGRPWITSRDYQERDPLSDTLCDGAGSREQILLVIAEDLLAGKTVGGGSELADAGGHDDDVLFARVGMLQHPAQVIQSVVVANGHQHVAGADAERAAVDRVALQQLEVILHMLFGERVLFPIHVFGNGEDHEKDCREGNTREGSDGLGSQVYEGCRE